MKIFFQIFHNNDRRRAHDRRSGLLVIPLQSQRPGGLPKPKCESLSGGPGRGPVHERHRLHCHILPGATSAFLSLTTGNWEAFESKQYGRILAFEGLVDSSEVKSVPGVLSSIFSQFSDWSEQRPRARICCSLDSGASRLRAFAE